MRSATAKLVKNFHIHNSQIHIKIYEPLSIRWLLRGSCSDLFGFLCLLLFYDCVFEAVLFVGVVAEHYFLAWQDVIVHILVRHYGAVIAVEPFHFFKPGVAELHGALWEYEIAGCGIGKD